MTQNNQNKKVCILTTSADIGGTEKTIKILLKGLKNKGYKLSLIVLKEYGDLNQFCVENDIEQKALGIKSLFSFIKLFRLFRYVKKEKQEVLLTFLFHSNIIARIIGRILKTPRVVCGQRNIDPWRNQFHILLDRWTSKWCDVIISNSEAGKKRLLEVEKISKTKVKVVYNGVKLPKKISQSSINLIKSEYGLDKFDGFKLLLCPASLTPKKDHLFLLNAIVEVLKINKKVVLILAGEGPERLKIEKWIKSKKVEKNILLLGNVTSVVELIQVCDLVVLSSLYEGIPNTLLETIACKKPFVARGVGGVIELSEYYAKGQISDKNNVLEFSKNIQLMLEVKNKLEIAKDTDFFERFSIENMLLEFEEEFCAKTSI